MYVIVTTFTHKAQILTGGLITFFSLINLFEIIYMALLIFGHYVDFPRNRSSAVPVPSDSADKPDSADNGEFNILVSEPIIT